MMMNRFGQATSLACLFLGFAILAGCKHYPTIEPVFCGDGTQERPVNGKRTCVIAPLSCGHGAHEQATGGQRECAPVDPTKVVRCASGTHQQEQAVGGQRECVPDPSNCPPGEIEIDEGNDNYSCRTAILTCGHGMHEQATGGQRECVPNPGVCGTNTQEQEQAIGGQRECLSN